MFFDWKNQFEKVQSKFYIIEKHFILRHPYISQNDQGYCDPTSRTHATIVWFPEDT